jgi:hypothetical protein
MLYGRWMYRIATRRALALMFHWSELGGWPKKAQQLLPLRDC